MLEFRNISCGYGDSLVCQHINLQIQKGKFTCIIGPNGAGKTTLLKTLSSIDNYSGDIFLNKKNLKNYKRKQIGQRIAQLTQITSSYFSYTVYDTVMLGRYPYLQGFFSFVTKKDHEIVQHALKQVGLFDIRNNKINALSGGQLQRVFLARTIAQQPEVIVLDEPTNHLDFKHQIEILQSVKTWSQKKNASVLAVLHDLNLVQRYADKVVLLYKGSILAQGNTKEVLSQNHMKKAYGIDVNKWMNETLSLWK